MDQAEREGGGGAGEVRPLDSALFDVGVVRKRLQISDIFVRYVRDGARTLSEVQRAMSAQDVEELTSICDGAPLRDVLMGGEHVAGTGCLAGQPATRADLGDGQAFRLEA